MLLGSAEIPRALARDYRTAPVSQADRIMLDYAVKLTRAPHSVSEADIDRLREAGFDDTGILDVCQVVSYYNYVNRLANGLGVELEDGWPEGALTLTRAEFRERLERGPGAQPEE